MWLPLNTINLPKLLSIPYDLVSTLAFMNYFRSFYCLCFVLLTVACTKDALPQPEPSLCGNESLNYEDDIRPIIEASCAYPGCHLGEAPGIYTSYAGVELDIERGLFRLRTIELRSDPAVGMPPDYAPEGRPKNLTEAELNLIECWLDAGYPQ